MEVGRKPYHVPLEEALLIAGAGKYTAFIIFACGFILFAAIANMQMMAVVISIASCDLNLSNKEKGVLTSAPFVGIAMSSHLFGVLSDLYGRRKIMVICTSTSAVVSFLSSFAPSVTYLACCWLIIGCMTGGLFTPGYVYVSEFCHKKIRARGVLIASSLSALATGYLPCVAWLIVPLNIRIPLTVNLTFTSWRLFIAVFPVTNLIPMFLMYNLPESPKFILNEGKEDETLQILETAYSINNNLPKDNYPVGSVCLDLCDMKLPGKKVKTGHPLIRTLKTVLKQAVALFSKKYLWYTSISALMIIGTLGMYNTFVLWMPQQVKLLMLHTKLHTGFNITMCEVLSHETDMEGEAGSCNLKLNAYLPSIFIGLGQFAAFIFVSTFADKVNKKYIIVVMTGLAALGSLGLEYAHQLGLIMFCLGLIIVLLLTTYPVALSIAVEFFPTSLRSTAASIILLCGRLAAIIGSQIFGFLYHVHCDATYWIAAFLLLGVSMLSALSPEKRKEECECTKC